MNTKWNRLILCLIAFLFSLREANAYTDPGSGALIWQILMGAAVGCMFYFRRFISWFGKKKGSDS